MKAPLFILSSILVIFAVAVVSSPQLRTQGLTASDAKLDYAIMIDAGSSGTRTFIYSWEHRAANANRDVGPLSSPVTQEQWSKRTKEKLADYATQPEKIAEALQPTIDFAKPLLEEFGVTDLSKVPIYLGATAGVRLLPQTQRSTLFKAIRDFYKKCDFQFEDHFAKILSGEEEGFFGFLSVNYLNNIILPSQTDKDVSDLKPYGALDLGGASTQITFDTRGEDLLEHYFEFQTPEYKRVQMYTNSFLQYGANQWWDRLMAEIIKTAGNANPIPNPCLNKGVELQYTAPDQQTYTFTGDMEQKQCTVLQQELLKSGALCLTDQCSINGVYQAPIPNDSIFYAFAGFEKIITAYIPKADQQTTPYAVKELAAAYQDICALSLTELKEKYPKVDPEFLPRGCASLMYQYSLLKDAYKFDTERPMLLVTDEINKQKISWTLGRIVYEVNLSRYERLTKEQVGLVAMGVAIATLMVAVVVLLFLLWRTWSKLSAIDPNSTSHSKHKHNEDSALFSDQSANGYV